MREYLNITNECNLELMKRYEDNHFDLAIVDPPYGIGFSSKKQSNFGKGGINHNYKNWDNEIPPSEYFKELQRVSKNQIIWGGNYFTEHLKPNRCWLSWYKMQEFSTNEFELAWTSFDKTCKQFNLSRVQSYVGTNKIHPTQKPTRLYQWILKNYANINDKILDTHLGSGSIAIALDSMNKIEKMNLTLTASEIDSKYYKEAVIRIEEETKWNSLF